ncbi:hypothetical protein ZWY2020_010452 [Hordeum vulgare]|nr:hypothetical protein ZWY2020_010452 [Hordeum vulgare]
MEAHVVDAGDGGLGRVHRPEDGEQQRHRASRTRGELYMYNPAPQHIWTTRELYMYNPSRNEKKKIWTTNNCILAALGGTLVVTAVVIIVSVILRPADISLSVTHASISNGSADGSIQYVNLTIAAANASRKRAGVRYQSFFVDLNNSSSTIHALVYSPPPKNEYLRPGTGPASVNASVLLLSSGTVRDFVGRPMNGREFTVVVTAKVRFQVGGVPTRLYIMNVSCPHVFFAVEGSFNSNALVLPIDCTA